MERFAAPDDLARAILFLAGHERSGFINGHAPVADGGWTIDGSWQSLRMRKRRICASARTVTAVDGCALPLGLDNSE